MTSYYLSSSTAFAEELEEAAAKLRGRGHEVTSRWHSGALGRISVNVQTEPKLAGERAVLDLQDLLRADVAVFRAGEPPDRRSRGGRHAEFGVALLRQTDPTRHRGLVLIGPPEHVFHCHPDVQRYGAWGDWLQTVEPVSGAPYTRPIA